MPMFQDRHDLFRSPTTTDKLNLLQSLSDAKDLTSDQALALINIIRAELERPQSQRPSAYRRYSEVMRSLHEQMPDVYEQLVNDWQQRRKSEPREEAKAEGDHMALEAAEAAEESEQVEVEEEEPPLEGAEE